MNAKDPVSILGTYVVLGLAYVLMSYTKADADADGTVTTTEWDTYFDTNAGFAATVFSPVVSVMKYLFKVMGHIDDDTAAPEE